jgi:predicted nucleotidyltransferase
MYKLKLTNLQQSILRLLFIKVGMPLNQRRIAQLLGVSQPAVMKAIPKLEKENMVKLQQDKESKRWAVELNRDNPKMMQLKKVDNLRQIYESGLLEFLEKKFPGGTVILFGSYARGEDTITSDIDIAVIGRKEKEIELANFEKILERTININFYDIFEHINKHLKENLCNGIVLS